MKKKIILSLLCAFTLLTLVVGCGKQEDKTKNGNNNQTNNGNNTNNILDGGYEVRISGDWKIKFPKTFSDRRNNNTYAVESPDDKFRFLFGGYMDGGWKTPELCDDLDSIVAACDESLRDRLSSTNSSQFSKNNVSINVVTQEKVTIKSFDMIKASGTITDSHKDSNYAFKAYYSLVDINGTIAPIYLFGYCESRHKDELNTYITEIINSFGKVQR